MTWTPDPLADSTAVIDSFLSGRPLYDRQDAIEVMCALQSEVSHSGITGRFPDEPADCFCGRWTRDFKNTGQSIRFIVELVREALMTSEREGVA